MDEIVETSVETSETPVETTTTESASSIRDGLVAGFDKYDEETSKPEETDKLTHAQPAPPAAVPAPTAPAALAASPATPPAGTPPSTSTPVSVTALKAPPSWRPNIRDEHWDKIPAPVQEEIHRRERDVANMVRQASGFKRTHDEFGQIYENFKDVFAYEGPNIHPMQTVSNLLNVVKSLRSGTPENKAEIMAELIQQFGIDVPQLDASLSKRVGPNGTFAPNIQPAVQAAVQAQMAPFNQFIQSFVSQQQQKEQEIASEASTELQAFASDPKNEFFNDVREEMADILELATRRGQKISLPTAYQRAIVMRSDLAAIVANRQLKSKAAEATAQAQAAKAKAVSISGGPALGSPGGPKTLRNQLVEAWDSAQE